MQMQLVTIPQFWQGVLASILGTIIILVGTKLYRMYAAQTQRTNAENKKLISAMETKLASPDPLIRIEGYFVALFSLMSYLFLGNLCWMFASVVSPLLRPADWPVVLGLELFSVVFFIGGLFWIKKMMRVQTIS